MNTTPAATFALPVPLLRSEAFAEDIIDFVDAQPEPVREQSVRWLVNLAPLAVALTGVAFALVPPLA
jgi:hypothetical protein